MGLMDGKKGIIFGIANEKSIAYACAKIAKKQGAKVAVTYLMPPDKYEKYLKSYVDKAGFDICMNCDATKNEDIDNVFKTIKEKFGNIDFLVHSMAFAKGDELGKIPFSHTSLEGYQLALNVSAYTFISLAKRGAELMTNGGSMTTMTYYGSEKVIPNYDIMGVAKASLEAITRYLAADLGKKNIRVNAISPGPIMTRAASGISDFDVLLKAACEKAPLKRGVTIEEVGNFNLFLCSDLGTGITGQTIYVDAGISIIGI